MVLELAFRNLFPMLGCLDAGGEASFCLNLMCYVSLTHMGGRKLSKS